MNMQGGRDGGSQYNTLASLLGTALYRSMSSSEKTGRDAMPAKRPMKNRLRSRLGFKVR